LAESILQEGKADLIAIGRGLIADPELPNKLADGKASEIRKCLSCNQGCCDRVYRLEDIECLINAQAGYEEQRKILPTSTRKKVLVVGGGPGGLEAARVAALRGHDVIMMEASDALGGQLRLVAAVPFRESWGRYVAYQETALKKLQVQVRTGKEATIEEIKSIAPDVVILATGANPAHLELPGSESVNLVNAWDILLKKAKVDTPAVVIGAGAVGLETAEFMAAAGSQVTLVEMLDQVGGDMSPGILALLLDRLKKTNVKILTRTKAVEFRANEVMVQTPEGPSVLPAKLVVEAVGVLPNDALEGLLNAEGIPNITAGDCREPRKAYQAVHEAFLAAVSV
jgi:NADPH-dependent 2,4-dienoyl-CoA reductase/sulfur reductase-like enzyme